MDVHDAVHAADFVQCSRVLGYHYDTFGYIEIDHEAAQKAFSEAGKTLTLLSIGATLSV